MNMRPLKEKISISIDNDILAEVRILADKSGRPLSQYINRVLQKHLKEIADKRTPEDWDEEEI